MISARFRVVGVVFPYAVACSFVAAAHGVETKRVQSPVPPAESLQHFALPAGLNIELVAHEPNVIDPVAVRFDELGRMWVVEMRDYPTVEANGTGKRSRISILRDRDEDGVFESATVFADGLPYATGLQPWKGGVFVTLAGEVRYMKDTDGDDRADMAETWYTGFAEQNTQLRANHPRLALDNHIYVANGLRGGAIIDVRRPHADPVSISGMDFRFDPATRQCEAVSGVGQFGMTFDDYGNRFVCTNRNPAIHVVIEDRHAKKNPLFALPAVSVDVAKAGDESRLYPIARSWTTSHLHAGQFTAACGIVVYGGDALPGSYSGNIFVCEPTAHLVHREVMQSDGVTFSSVPAIDGVEFLASRDEWFSPVNLEVAPDGALYVVDMYRAVIEHPEWMPEEMRERVDLTAGNDRGRIYRIVPQDFKRPKSTLLADKSSQKLVELLADGNGWTRDTAARLLLERLDKSVEERLEQVARESGAAPARVRALWLLKSIGEVSYELLAHLLEDADPRIVEQAIVAGAERFEESPQLREQVARLVEHPDARLRFQAWLAAVPLPVKLSHRADRWERYAMLIAAGRRGGTALSELLKRPTELMANVDDARQFVAELARLAAASADEDQHAVAVGALVDSTEFGRAGLAALFAELESCGDSIEALQARLDASVRRDLAAVRHQARLDAMNAELPELIRAEAVNLLSFDPMSFGELRELALEDANQPVRLRAIAALARHDAIEPWRHLLRGFSSESPRVQRAIVGGALSETQRATVLLDEVAGGGIRPTELDATSRKQLLNHHDEAIRRRAVALFAAALPADREKTLAAYRSSSHVAGSPARGRVVFEKHCAACHRVGGVGVSFAPDISDSREKTTEQLLMDILQPSRAIDSNYFSYTAITVDGSVHTGVLAGETSTSITLKQSEGKAITIHRERIDTLRSDGVSYMPEGLEQNINPQQMADLIEFIKSWRYMEAELE